MELWSTLILIKTRDKFVPISPVKRSSFCNMQWFFFFLPIHLFRAHQVQKAELEPQASLEDLAHLGHQGP